MKSRFGLYVAGLLAVSGALGCGEEREAPANNQVIVPGIERAGAPSDLVVTPENAQVSLTWKAPEDDGGARISGYTVWTYEAGKAAKPQAVKGTGTSATVTGLTNGTAYTFAVAATTSLGDGPQTALSEPVKPRTIPGVIRNGKSVAGDRQATITWSAPEDTGMPIVSYTVRMEISDDDSHVATQTVTDTQATFTGLTNGVAYNVLIFANNSVTAGPEGRAPSFIPFTIPGLVRIEAKVNDTRTLITLTMTVDDDGGRQPTFRVVTTENDKPYRIAESGDTYDIEVNAGATYKFIANAFNSAGDGPTAEPLIVTP